MLGTRVISDNNQNLDGNQTLREQRQNLREQEEIKTLFRRTATKPTAKRPKESAVEKDQKIADLIKQEKDLFEEDDNLRLKMFLLSKKEDDMRLNSINLNHLMTKISLTYQTETKLCTLRDKIQEDFKRLEDSYQKEKDGLSNRRRKIADLQEEIYQARVCLVNSSTEGDLD